MKRLLAKSFLLAGGMTVSSQLLALGLGEISLDSALNQPLIGEIQLIDSTSLSNDAVKASLASAADFERAGVERYEFLKKFQFTVMGDSVRITSREPINEPFLNFLVELNWPSGRVLREYTLLLDPPKYTPVPVTPAASATVNTIAPTINVVTRQPSVAPTTVARPTAKPAYSGGFNAQQGTYKVQPNDTLWEIAQMTRPDSSVTSQQMMLAIQDKNPDAFIKNNINLVKSNVTLEIPTLEEVRAISQRDAVAEVRRQSNVMTAKTAQIDATGRNTDAPAAKNDTSLGEVRLLSANQGTQGQQSGASGVAGQGGSSDNASELEQALETLDKTRREKDELADRLGSLEAQLKEMQRLLTLQNSQLASLQAETVEKPTSQEPAPKVAASTPSTTTLDNTEVVEASVGQEESDVVDQVTNGESNTLDTLPEQTDTTSSVTDSEETDTEQTVADMASSEAATAEMDNSEVENADTTMATTETDVVAPAEVENPVVAEPVAPKQEPKTLVTPKAPSVLDMFMEFKEFILIGIGALLVLIFGLMRLRGSNKKEEENEWVADDNDSDAVDNDPFINPDLNSSDPEKNEFAGFSDSDTNSDFDDFAADVHNPITGDGVSVEKSKKESGSSLDDFDIHDDDHFDFGNEISQNEQPEESPTVFADTVGQTEDAISESDVYVAFGKFDQAVALLSNAIDEQPTRIDLRMKQLEILSSLDDEEQFAQAEAGLIELGDEQANAEALTLREMLSRPIAPKNSDAKSDLSLDNDLPTIDDDLEQNFDEVVDFAPALDDESRDATPKFGEALESVPDLDLDEKTDFDASSEGYDLSLDDASFDLGMLDEDDLDSKDDLDSEDKKRPDDKETVSKSNTEDFAPDDLDEDIMDTKFDFEESDSDDFFADDTSTKSINESSAVKEESEDVVLDSVAEDLDETSTDSIDESSAAKEESEDVVLNSLAEDTDDLDDADDFDTLSSDEEDSSNDLIGGIDLDELAAADDEFDFLSGTDECATKLDLARAYIDMEDAEGARDLLDEVIHEGNEQQRNEARSLMDKLS